MIGRIGPAILQERRAAVLAAMIVVQALCALFFLSDVVADFFEPTTLDLTHFLIEALAALVLTAGVVFMMFELRRLLEEFATLTLGIRAARGKMTEVVEEFFTEWALTPSERDVAMMVLKGVDNDTIARIRGTASGTVRAQCTQIYAKAGVDGRAQLISLFFEELLMTDEDEVKS